MRRNIRIVVLLCLHILLFPFHTLSQSLTLYDIDASDYPVMRAKFYAFDADGNQLSENRGNRHVTALAADGHGCLYAGTATDGVLRSCSMTLPTDCDDTNWSDEFDGPEIDRNIWTLKSPGTPMCLLPSMTCWDAASRSSQTRHRVRACTLFAPTD